MPVKTQFISEQSIKAIPLPQHGKTYTVIPHGYAIDQTKAQLAAAGFNISQELYKSTQDGQIVQGVYHLDYGTDPDMGLMFAWSNSYNKQMRFKCAVGARVFVCMNGVVSGNIGNYHRKHSGSALHDVTEQIKDKISMAAGHYDQLIEDKELLKTIILTQKDKGAILGRLFAEKEILTLTQVGIVKRELEKPRYTYNCDPDSAWAMYNHITVALHDSHPSTYLKDHEVVHEFFIDEYGTLQTTNVTTAVQPDLFTQVIEEEKEEELELSSPGFGVMFL